MPENDTPALEPLRPHDPDRVGRYRLAGRLGAGGMGVVYAGSAADGRRVAIKVVRPELAHDPDFRDRFSREVSLLDRVRGRCVARVVDADPGGALPWFATEYLPGPTLDRRIDRHGPMSGDELHGLAVGLAEALAALHSREVVHRDLKPSNLILAPDGPKVVDFGIARALDETMMTRTGVILGSSGWISPEHYRGDAVGPPADVYAWGLIVYFAATGRLPYGPGRPEVVAARVLNTTLDTAGLPDRYREMVERALAKDPRARPSSSELLAAVATPLGHEDPLTAATAFLDRTWIMPPGPDDPAWEYARRRPSRRRTYLLGGGVAAAAVTAAVVAGLLVFLPSDSLLAHVGSGQASPRDGAPTSSAPAPSTAAPTPTGLRGSRIHNNSGLSYVVPTGWTSTQSTGMSGGADDCLTPQEFDKSICGHGGLEIQTWAKGEQPDYDTPTGWANYGDAGNLPGCVSDTSGDLTKAITADGVTVRGTRPVGGRTAVYREYRLQCRNGWSSTPRLWWLPQSGVLMETIELPDRYRDTVDAIARSIELTGYERPDPPTG
jgi:eukaryotic-like serine/threonine-protein kinase